MKTSLRIAAVLSVVMAGAAHAQYYYPPRIAPPSTDPRVWIYNTCLRQGHSPPYCQCWTYVALGTLNPETVQGLMGNPDWYGSQNWNAIQAEQRATAMCNAQFGR